MPEPTQKELKAAVILMLKSALDELQGTLDLELEKLLEWQEFEFKPWQDEDIRPMYQHHPYDDCAFWIDNPHDMRRPFKVKVSIPQLGWEG